MYILVSMLTIFLATTVIPVLVNKWFLHKWEERERLHRLERIFNSLNERERWPMNNDGLKPGEDRVLAHGEFDDLIEAMEKSPKDEVETKTLETRAYLENDEVVVEVIIPLDAPMSTIPMQVTLDIGNVVKKVLSESLKR